MINSRHRHRLPVAYSEVKLGGQFCSIGVVMRESTSSRREAGDTSGRDTKKEIATKRQEDTRWSAKARIYREIAEKSETLRLVQASLRI